MEQENQYYVARTKLVDKLLVKGITNRGVLDAINRIPREAFMAEHFRNYAYADKAFSIGEGQTISQPYTVAFQTQLLDVHRGDKVLEIGTGSGYQCAVLCEMGAEVYTIERIAPLFEKARDLLQLLGYNAHLFLGDGYQGLPYFAPFDKTIVTACSPKIPPNLLEQLKPGGKLVAPIGNPESQQMILVEKLPSGGYKQTAHGNFVFVPLIHS